MPRSRLLWTLVGGTFFALSPFTRAPAQNSYRPILPGRSGETVVLTGHDLTPDQVVAIARYGAKVALSPEAKQRQSDAYGLLLEASTEGIAIYGDRKSVV